MFTPRFRPLWTLGFLLALAFGIVRGDDVHAADTGVKQLAESIKKGLSRAHMSEAGVWAETQRRRRRSSGSSGSGGASVRPKRPSLLKDGVHFLLTSSPDSNKLTGLALNAITALDLSNYTISTYVHDSTSRLANASSSESLLYKRLVQRWGFYSNRLQTLPPGAVLILTTNEVFMLPSSKPFMSLVHSLSGPAPKANPETGEVEDAFDVLCLPRIKEGGCDGPFLVARNGPKVAKVAIDILQQLHHLRRNASRGSPSVHVNEAEMLNTALVRAQARVLPINPKHYWSGAIGCDNFDRHSGHSVALLNLAGPCPNPHDKIVQANRALQGYLKQIHRGDKEAAEHVFTDLKAAHYTQ